MLKDTGRTTSSEAMRIYSESVRDRLIADFDVTQIGELGVIHGANEENPQGNLVTFEYLSGLSETVRNSLLTIIQNGYAVNFGMPKGVTWENGIPDSRPIFDINLMD